MKKYTIKALEKEIEELAINNVEIRMLKNLIRDGFGFITDESEYVTINTCANMGGYYQVLSIELLDEDDEEETVRVWFDDGLMPYDIEKALEWAGRLIVDSYVENFDTEEEMRGYVSYQLRNNESVQRLKEIRNNPIDYLSALYSTDSSHCFNFDDLDEDFQDEMISLTIEEIDDILSEEDE